MKLKNILFLGSRLVKLVVIVLICCQASLAKNLHAQTSKVNIPNSGGELPQGVSQIEWQAILSQIKVSQQVQTSTVNLSQQAYVKSSNTQAGFRFGYSVAISGHTMVVGARFEDEPLAARAGAVYVFVRRQGVWSQQARLVASNVDENDWFGLSVAIYGNTLVIGAPFEDSNAREVNGDQSDNSKHNSGAAYVFVRSNSIWQQQAYIKSTNTDADDNFGISVAINEDTIIIGAPLEDSNATGSNGNQADNSAMNSGAAYIYQRFNPDLWVNKGYIKASNSEALDRFGRAVDITEDLFVVGAEHESSNATGVNGDQNNNLKPGSGAAYVFSNASGSWLQQAYLKASNSNNNDRFGLSVAISNLTTVVGASGEDNSATGINGNETLCCDYGSGAAYVFTKDIVNNLWSQEAYMKASNTGGGDFFGETVAIDRNTIVVGAVGEKSNATGVNGNQFDDSSPNSGAVYTFTRASSVWSQQAYIKASNSETLDVFGSSIAISNDTILVGVSQEDSNATGINGNENNNSADEAGAAYVFNTDLLFGDGFEE